MTTWRTGAPLELIRFAGANRFKVEIDYEPNGRRGPRVVEPYSQRRTRAGHLVLFVVNDHGHLRAYRADRIAGVAITREPFPPTYHAEFDKQCRSGRSGSGLYDRGQTGRLWRYLP